ncbi:MAG TPA: DUF6152 family protein [Gammaproteobacteria bacterium]|nr:DUF6152 family protein [Gammaproteobacteria bacterium]
MKIEAIGAALLAAVLLTAPATAPAQTEQQRLSEAMRLQRATFNENAAGNLDAAIEIYREIAGPGTADRALAAEAQYRLSQALLQKGDLAGSSEALVRLSTNFPDQAERISRLAGGSPPRGGVVRAPGAADPAELQKLQGESFATVYGGDFVPGGTQTLTTHVERVSWTNPVSWLGVSDGATHWSLLLPAPNMLLRLGMTRESLPLGEQITVVFTTDARGTSLTADGSTPGRVESIVRVRDQVTVFDRAAIPASAQP